jgi:tRNA threonylcarbamoyl adenosine modification protein YeaZ
MAGLYLMNSLVIDTATDRTSCALFINNELAFYEFHDGATEHAEALPKLVANALLESNQIDQVIVGMGPGPFTGLRVGIVFAQTFAKARNIPWVGVCSLDGILVSENEYIVATDARRKEVYWAKYQSGKRIAGPFVSSPSELNDQKVFGLEEPIYPNPKSLLSAAKSAPITEPLYLRRPDALPTNERK